MFTRSLRFIVRFRDLHFRPARCTHFARSLSSTIRLRRWALTLFWLRCLAYCLFWQRLLGRPPRNREAGIVARIFHYQAKQWTSSVYRWTSADRSHSTRRQAGLWIKSRSRWWAFPFWAWTKQIGNRQVWMREKDPAWRASFFPQGLKRQACRERVWQIDCAGKFSAAR